MRLKLIACKSMFREFCSVCASSENTVDATFIRQGYHETPELLRKTLQDEIDAVESGDDPRTGQVSAEDDDSPQKLGDFDAILLGYGLCSNGIAGLCAKSHPLVIPRAHDCITLLLGSRERYQACFKQYPGCFWYTASWIENSAMPCQFYHEKQLAYWRAQDYDEEDIAYCDETMNGWTKNYHYAGYIRMEGSDFEKWRTFTKDAADYYHWDYLELDGDTSLLQRLVGGDWNPKDFLVVPPGHRVTASGDIDVLSYR